MKNALTIASGVAVLLATLAGGLLWASSSYAKLERIPVLEGKIWSNERSIAQVHRNLCKVLGTLGLSGSGC